MPTTDRTVRGMRVVRAAGAWLLIVGILVGVPALLVAQIGWPLPHHLPTGHTLSRPPRGRFALDVLGVAGWATWAWMTLLLVGTARHVLTGAATTGLAPWVTQQIAVQLVTAALTLTVPVSSTHHPAPGPTAHPAKAGLVTRPTQPSEDASSTRQALGVDVRAPARSHQTGVDDLSAPVGSSRTNATATLTDTLRAGASATTVDAPASGPEPTPTLGEAPSPAGQAPSATATPPAYVVQPGDTLWGIAQAHLGNGEAWPQIYQLNQGRPQPNGRTLTDPHWIDPGWTLTLSAPPAATAVEPQPPAASAPPAAPPAVRPQPSDRQGGDVQPQHRQSPPPESHLPAPAARHVGAVSPKRSPSGSLIAGSIVAALITAAAIARFRQRTRYRYRPPSPGRVLADHQHPRTLLEAITSLADDDNDPPKDPGTSGITQAESLPTVDGLIPLGVVGNRTVYASPSDLSGLCLEGEGGADTARSWAAAAISDQGSPLAGVLISDELAPGLQHRSASESLGGRLRVAKAPVGAQAVEVELIARKRRFSATGVDNLTEYSAICPEDRLGTVLIFAEHADSTQRWSSLLGEAERAGIVVVFLGAIPDPVARLTVESSGKIKHADGPANTLAGGEAFRLSSDEFDTVVTHFFSLSGGPELLAIDGDPGAVADETRQTPRQHEEPWPNVAVDPIAKPPIRVRLLGPWQLTAWEKPVVTGLRSRARLLLCWYLLRPEGATPDAAVDALWPNTAPDAVRRQFWRALGELRSRLSAPDNEPLEVLEKIGDRYRVVTREIDCDLWDFQRGLIHASEPDGDELAGLRRAVRAYAGDLHEGNSEVWIELTRQDLHRRALNAHLRLAELEQAAGNHAVSIDVLERVVDLDQYAEEPYQRLMVYYAQASQPNQVHRTWHRLQRAMLDLDLEPSEASRSTYHRLFE